MDVKTYVFQSPYPSAVQVGRPDPLAVDSSSGDKEAVDALQSAGDDTQRQASFYQSQSTASSINVALSTSDSAVSESLEGFSSLNTAQQASIAYVK